MAITVALDDLTVAVTNAFRTDNHNHRRRDRRSNQVHVPAYVDYNQIMESILLQVRRPSELKKLQEKILEKVESLSESLPEKGRSIVGDIRGGTHSHRDRNATRSPHRSQRSSDGFRVYGRRN